MPRPTLRRRNVQAADCTHDGSRMIQVRASKFVPNVDEVECEWQHIAPPATGDYT